MIRNVEPSSLKFISSLYSIGKLKFYEYGDRILTSKSTWRNLILRARGFSTKRPLLLENLADKLVTAVRLASTVGKSLLNGVPDGLLPVHVSFKVEVLKFLTERAWASPVSARCQPKFVITDEDNCRKDC